ncbi:MAG: hypothetical protein HUK25_05620, partial [Treponema sp.]|nr:hypothetical protein [Treponema sp.]
GTLGTSSINGSVSTQMDQKYEGVVTLMGDSVFTVSYSDKQLSFIQGFTGASDKTITINGNTEIAGTNTFGTVNITGDATFFDSNTYTNLTCETAGKILKFAGGKTQTVSGKIKITGEAGNLITLTTSDATPSASNKWILKVTSTINDTNVQIKYANVSYGEASNTFAGLDLAGSGKACVNGGNTKQWFKGSHYKWISTSTSDWATVSNWEDDADSGIAPDVNNTDIEIEVDGSAVLNLPSAVSLKSITVNTGKEIDFQNYNVTVSDATAGITNNGTIRMAGSQTISGVMKNGTGSIIEYYDDCSSLPWDGGSDSGKQYENLVFSSGSSCTNSSDEVLVSGNTKIFAGTGKAVSLINSGNTFTGNVTIGDDSASPKVNGGAVTLAGTGTIKITDGAYCDSLTINN